MAKFKSTRDQAIDGKHVKAGATVEVDAERVQYLIARGFLVDTAKKTAKAKAE